MVDSDEHGCKAGRRRRLVLASASTLADAPGVPRADVRLFQRQGGDKRNEGVSTVKHPPRKPKEMQVGAPRRRSRTIVTSALFLCPRMADL